jgi:hypothetical protein
MSTTFLTDSLSLSTEFEQVGDAWEMRYTFLVEFKPSPTKPEKDALDAATNLIDAIEDMSDRIRREGSEMETARQWADDFMMHYRELNKE